MPRHMETRTAALVRIQVKGGSASFYLGTSETQQIWRCVSGWTKLGNNGLYKSQNNCVKIEKFSQSNQFCLDVDKKLISFFHEIGCYFFILNLSILLVVLTLSRHSLNQHLID